MARTPRCQPSCACAADAGESPVRRSPIGTIRDGILFVDPALLGTALQAPWARPVAAETVQGALIAAYGFQRRGNQRLLPKEGMPPTPLAGSAGVMQRRTRHQH